MSMRRYAAVLGTGSAVPDKVITNHDLAQMVDTTDEWIRQRTGIVERRVAEEGIASSDLGALASSRALEAAGVDPNDLDMILCSTISPDMSFPSTACLISRALGIEKPIPAMDLAAACSGFSYGLQMADGLIRSGINEKVLVVAAETLTRYVDWTDRATCVLFGDAAGAVVLGATDPKAGEETGILYSKLGSLSQYSDVSLLGVPAGGSRKPASAETVAGREHFIQMQGREVYKLAVSTLPDAASDTISEAGLTPDDIDLIIPHQANIRIMEAFVGRLGLTMDRVYVNIDKYGNTSSASAPLALDEAVRLGRAKKGDTVMLITFGAGFTWGANIVRL
ncbi:MAG: ketoacyl-ACP synthase III [Candidatus Poribacteria bacterium]|nr:ketoacyl-ACP synthase III [Candidatus Poribacteria bacterium]